MSEWVCLNASVLCFLVFDRVEFLSGRCFEKCIYIFVAFYEFVLQLHMDKKRKRANKKQFVCLFFFVYVYRVFAVVCLSVCFVRFLLLDLFFVLLFICCDLLPSLRLCCGLLLSLQIVL